MMRCAVDDKPLHVKQLPGESYDEYFRSNKNRFLCVVVNKYSGPKFKVCEIAKNGEWTGHTQDNPKELNPVEVVTHWKELPPLPFDLVPKSASCYGIRARLNGVSDCGK